jgi:hypothetical protein
VSISVCKALLVSQQVPYFECPVTNDAKQTYLAKTYGHQLHGYFAARLRGAAVADLSQAVYMPLLRVENYKTIRDPPAYVFTIASHVLHQHGVHSTTDL